MSEASRGSRKTWTLAFYTAPWCEPAVPMMEIFKETVAELAQELPEESIVGVVVDVDEEETNQSAHSADGLVSMDALESVDYLPLIVLYEDEFPRRATERLRLTGQLPKRYIRSAVRDEILQR